MPLPSVLETARAATPSGSAVVTECSNLQRLF